MFVQYSSHSILSFNRIFDCKHHLNHKSSDPRQRNFNHRIKNRIPTYFDIQSSIFERVQLLLCDIRKAICI